MKSLEFYCCHCGLAVALAIPTGSVSCPVCRVLEGDREDNDYLRVGARIRGVLRVAGCAFYPTREVKVEIPDLHRAATKALERVGARWVGGNPAYPIALGLALETYLENTAPS